MCMRPILPYVDWEIFTIEIFSSGIDIMMKNNV